MQSRWQENRKRWLFLSSSFTVYLIDCHLQLPFNERTPFAHFIMDRISDEFLYKALKVLKTENTVYTHRKKKRTFIQRQQNKFAYCRNSNRLNTILISIHFHFYSNDNWNIDGMHNNINLQLNTENETPSLLYEKQTMNASISK